MARILYPALLTATLALAAALCLGPTAANKLLSFVGVVKAQSPQGAGAVPPGGSGDGSQYVPGFNTGPSAPYNHLMTTAPTQPTPVVQPQNWAAGAQAPGSNTAARSVYVPPPGAPAAKPLESAVVIARIGPEVVLASDLNPRYQAYLDDKAAGAPAEQLASERQELVSEMKNLIDVKLLVVEATDTIPPDGLKDFQGKVNDQFDKVQVKEMMDRVKVKSTAELDAVLHQYGSSLERKRQVAFEQTLAHEWLSEHAKSDQDIDFDTALVYYHEHKAEFSYPAQARWEQLTALFANFSDRRQAWNAIVGMGNDVLRNVAPFSEVAKKKSQGPTKDSGGYRDWTTKGALVSKVLDEALFSPNLPVGRMSTIIEDTDGYHIIRVIERKDAGVVPFRDAQGGIKKKLKEERLAKKTTEYLEKLRSKTQIWTVFDNPAGPTPPGRFPSAQTAPPPSNYGYRR